MTDHAARIYAVALAVVLFFVSWATVAAHPWAAAQQDRRLAALGVREQRLRVDAKLVQRVVDARWADYRVALVQRRAQIASARSAQLASVSTPAVRVVNLPLLTITRTS